MKYHMKLKNNGELLSNKLQHILHIYMYAVPSQITWPITYFRSHDLENKENLSVMLPLGKECI